MSPASDRFVVELSAAEALTVVAALRQYMPYWRPGEHVPTPAEYLAQCRGEITSVIAKLREAAAAAE